MQRIVITGSNGFVGNAIAKCLSKKYYVIGVSKASHSRNEFVREYYSVDISDSELVEDLNILDVETVIHCSASLDKNLFSDELFTVNCIGIKNIAKFAKKNNVSQFIYISGIHIIGKPYTFPIDEDHGVNPQSTYHLTKYFGEQFLENVFLPEVLTIMRLASPIGTNLDSSKIVSTFVKNSLLGLPLIIVGNGKRVQNYIDVDDVAVAVDKAISIKAYGKFNIASDTSISNFQLAKYCIKLFKSTSSIEFIGIDLEEDYRWIISNEKAKKILGFYPEIDLKTSISNLANTIIR